MLERDLTDTNGIISQLLEGTGWLWERAPDSGKQTNSVGFDGKLIYPPVVQVTVEVKLANRYLTATQDAKLAWCKKHGLPYFVLRYWTNERWMIADYNSSKATTGTLLYCVRWIRYKYL